MEIDHCVIWSVFFDAYIIVARVSLGARTDTQYIGTRAECDAWIVRNKGR